MPMPTLFLPGFSACTHLICKYESCSAKVSYLKQNSKIISKFFCVVHVFSSFPTSSSLFMPYP